MSSVRSLEDAGDGHGVHAGDRVDGVAAESALVGEADGFAALVGCFGGDPVALDRFADEAEGGADLLVGVFDPGAPAVLVAVLADVGGAHAPKCIGDCTVSQCVWRLKMQRKAVQMDPTPVVRAVTYERDGERCVACGTGHPLSFQHRHNALRRERPLYHEGVTACVLCNALFEGTMQGKAYRYGWKLRRWVTADRVALVPVFVQWEHRWYLLDREGGRALISGFEATTRMRSIYGPAWDGWDR